MEGARARKRATKRSQHKVGEWRQAITLAPLRAPPKLHSPLEMTFDGGRTQKIAYGEIGRFSYRGGDILMQKKKKHVCVRCVRFSARVRLEKSCI